MLQLTKVPKKHIPYLIKSVWKEVSKTFESDELRIIFSLVAFFLGLTPFRTPAIYTLLNYTEMRHNSYWSIKGGMYRPVEELVSILMKRNIEIIYNSEIVDFHTRDDRIIEFIDQNGNRFGGNVFIVNSNPAFF